MFSTPFPETSWQIPWLHSLFGNAPAVATGVAAALKASGRTDTRVVAQRGDGGTVDIGIACLSGLSLTIEKMRLDDSGFPQPTGEFEELSADCLVLALGQDADLAVLEGVPDVTFSGGTVAVGPDLMTGHPGIFAGGDLVPDERTVTVAIGHGKKAAREVTGGLDTLTALFEARRCLSCGNCSGCGNCYGACPDNAVIKLDTGQYVIDYDHVAVHSAPWSEPGSCSSTARAETSATGLTSPSGLTASRQTWPPCSLSDRRASNWWSLSPATGGLRPWAEAMPPGALESCQPSWALGGGQHGISDGCGRRSACVFPGGSARLRRHPG